MANEKSNIWALLIGINEYLSPNISTLRGCVNDVEAVRRFLINNLSVPKNQIKILINEESTRPNIIDAFESFLIDNPEIARGSQILFHFSGHGSQMRNTSGMEPDGWDETIVPHDSRTGDVYDIPDKTLAGLIYRLAAAKGDKITVILDSCHSGSGTREALIEGAAPTRHAPADDRLPPADLDADLRLEAVTRSASRSGWTMTRSNHTLLAGCLDREESHEHETPGGVRHGAFTYFALEYLRRMPLNATYADWCAYVKMEVNKLYPQTPQCEGQRNRVVFGGAYVEHDPFIPIEKVVDDGITFEAGLVHGLSEGVELAIYPTSVTTKRNLPEPLATAEIKSVTATKAYAVFIKAPESPLPLDAHALATRQAYAGIRQKVALMPGKSTKENQALLALRETILNTGGEAKPSPLLELMDDQLQPADLRVTAEDGKLSIRDKVGNLLVHPQDFNQGGTAVVRQALESIARYRTILDLANHRPSQLTGKIKLRLRRCTQMIDSDCEAAEELPAASDDALTLEYDPDERNIYVVDIINDSAVEVYPHLFIFNPDYSIYHLYPAQGQNETLKPGMTISSGLPGSGGSALEIYLPGDAAGEERWDLSHECLKVILTTAPSNLEMLKQDPLSVPAQRKAAHAAASPFEQLLDTVTSGAATRGKPYKPTVSEEWETTELPYTVVRSARTKMLETAKGSIELGDGVTLEKPQGFEGKIAIAPLEQVRRSVADEPSLKLPPGLVQWPELFEPLARRGTRGLSGQPLVITLEADDASRALITQENPLRLRLPDEFAADDFLPVAFDGEDYLPVGYASGRGAVDVVRVPRAVAGPRGAPSRRGVGRAIRLFVFKKLGRYIRDIGLRYVENKTGSIEYSEVKKDRFRPGDRIAVFVHGFLSDTSWMARDVAPFLRKQVLPYEHALAWDYETFGASVETNGADLAIALRQQCGCGPNDGLTVHVYAHSMGSLVVRCLVELFGGHEFVDRLILAGPPNRGTTLATLSRSSFYLLSALTNNIAAIPLAGAADWLVKELYEQGVGWRDLAVDSDITKRLNALDAPLHVPYLVLAGTNALNQAQGSRLNRLAQKTLDQSLDLIFGETENDAMIGMSSLKGVRHGAYPALTVKSLPCDHFSYFSTAEGQAVVRQWMLNGR